MRSILVDSDQQDELAKNGYTVIPILSEERLRDLRRAVEALRPADGFAPDGNDGINAQKYHCTFLDTNKAYKRKFDSLVREFFTPIVSELMPTYRILIANCYAKQPGIGQFEIHQNWNITRELNEASLTMWVPLAASSSENGGIQIVPGTHHLVDAIAYPRGGHYFQEYTSLLADRYLETLELGAGEAVVFDDSLIHSSGLNSSSMTRFALQIELIPIDSTPAIFLAREDSRFDVVSAPTEFYLETTYAEIDRWREMFPVLDQVDNPNRPISADEFEHLLTVERKD